MKFKIFTLIDITESGQRRGPDKLAIGQQSNWDTLIQVIGLRANPTPVRTKQYTGSITDIGFGSKYSGEQTYWTFTFTIDYGETSADNLIEDFNLVPIITGLSETVDIDINVFKTKDDKERNIIFMYSDND